MLNFDFYGLKPQIFITKKPRHQTYFGFVLVLITTVCILTLGIYLFISFLNGDELSVVYSKQSENLDMEYSLKNRIFFYKLYTEDGSECDPRIAKVITTLTSSGNQVQLKETPCDISRFTENPEEYKNLLNLNLSALTCVDFLNGSEVFLERKKAPFKNSYINLYVVKCNKEEDSNCFDNNYIEDYLKKHSVVLGFYLESSGIDHMNNKKPISKSFYQNEIYLTNELFIYNYVYFWRKVMYETNNGVIFDNKKKYESFVLDAAIKDKEIYPLDTKFYYDNIIGKFQFIITVEYIDLYQRSYTKFTTFLANFLGWFNLITTICEFLNYFVTVKYLRFRALSYGIRARINRMNSNNQSGGVNNFSFFSRSFAQINNNINAELINCNKSPKQLKPSLSSIKDKTKTMTLNSINELCDVSVLNRKVIHGEEKLEKSELSPIINNNFTDNKNELKLIYNFSKKPKYKISYLTSITFFFFWACFEKKKGQYLSFIEGKVKETMSLENIIYKFIINDFVIDYENALKCFDIENYKISELTEQKIINQRLLGYKTLSFK